MALLKIAIKMILDAWRLYPYIERVQGENTSPACTTHRSICNKEIVFQVLCTVSSSPLCFIIFKSIYSEITVQSAMQLYIYCIFLLPQGYYIMWALNSNIFSAGFRLNIGLNLLILNKTSIGKCFLISRAVSFCSVSVCGDATRPTRSASLWSRLLTQPSPLNTFFRNY